MTSWIGQTLNGRFEVESHLGQGGMAAVYLARDLRLEGRRVVVKHPLREADRLSGGLSDDELRKRFRSEVSRLIQLDDIPHVVPILDQGVHEGTPFYVMRLMAGGSLADVLKGGPQAPGEALAWLAPVAQALDRLHERGVLHRDVKPENLLFDQPPTGPKGSQARAHLSDFGIVKELQSEWGTTGCNTGIGTPGYMAPEQLLEDAEPDGRADQFSLAATLYHALTGSKPLYVTTGGRGGGAPGGPLGGAAPAARKRLKPVTEVAAHVPDVASAVIESALSRKPEARYSTCTAFVEALVAALNDATGTARERGAVLATPTRQAASLGRATTDRPAAPPAGPGGGRRWLLVLLVLGALGGIGCAALSNTGGAGARECGTPFGRQRAAAPTQAPAPEPARTPAPTPPAAASVPTWARISSAQNAEAQRLGVPVAYEEASTGLRFVLIPGGTFQMGSPDGEIERERNEGPVHTVRLSAYYLSLTEVTNAQYKRFKPDYKGSWDGPTQPVETVSHADAEAFAAWMNGQGTQKGYRLPTESEWEYAARAGTTTRWSFGEDASHLREYAWFSGNSGDGTHPVAEKKPNPWGLFDMHGNVWEWCADDWHDDYKSAPTDGSAWIDSPRAADRVIRGGGWSLDAQVLRSAYRDWYTQAGRYSPQGFRLARSVTAR